MIVPRMWRESVSKDEVIETKVEMTPVVAVPKPGRVCEANENAVLSYRRHILSVFFLL